MMDKESRNVITALVAVIVILAILCIWCYQKSKKSTFEGSNYGWTMQDVLGGYHLGPSYGCGQQSKSNQCHSQCTGAPHGESYVRCMESCQE